MQVSALVRFARKTAGSKKEIGVVFLHELWTYWQYTTVLERLR